MLFAPFKEGLELANWDLLRTILRIFVKQKMIDADDLCAELRVCYDKYQQVVDNTGAYTEANAAHFLRQIMIELKCKNVPE